MIKVNGMEFEVITMKYKVTKLKVLDNPDNKKTNDELKDLNDVRIMTMIAFGFTGGLLHVEEGQTFIGYLNQELVPGNIIDLSGAGDFFRSSKIKEVRDDNGNFLVTTANSIYRVSKIDE